MSGTYIYIYIYIYIYNAHLRPQDVYNYFIVAFMICLEYILNN